MKRFRSRAAEEAFARTEVFAANERRRIQEMREIQARQSREEAEAVAQARNPIKVLDEDVRFERPFHDLGFKAENSKAVDDLMYLSKMYSTIGDEDGARHFYDEAFALTAQELRFTSGKSPSLSHVQNRLPSGNFGTPIEAEEVERAAGEVSATFRQAIKQEKPTSKFSYLQQRELGRK